MSATCPYDPKKDLSKTTSCSNPAIEPGYVYEASSDLNYKIDQGNTIPVSDTTWICPDCGQLNSTIRTIICSSCGFCIIRKNVNE